MKQPCSGEQIDERNPVRKQQELPQQDKPERYINRIAADGKDPCCHQIVRAILINADAEAFAKGHEAQK